MLKHAFAGLAWAALWLSSPGQLQAASYATAVVSYDPGQLASNLATYTNASAALGEPSRVTPGQFGGPVDPFDPPYLNTQLVALGTNGSLTVQLAQPITPDPAHPFGLDFIIFGSAGFIITNNDYSGGGITDGSMFGTSAGETRISVSADNVTYYTLNPPLTVTLDNLFPTDGVGDFSIPVNPGLSVGDFAGQGLAGIRRLYAGSGGGTGFSLAWARDAHGQPVTLTNAPYVRIEVLNGHAEIGGLAAVAPRPGFREDFATDPTTRGWRVLGDPSLFHWNATNQNLEVTWDSSRSNSFYARPLRTVLDKTDDFSLAFDLVLQGIRAGVNSAKPDTFEIAVSLINQANATSPTYIRGTGTGSPNLVEWDYFPDTGFGATIAPSIVSSNNQFMSSFSFPLTLTPSNLYHVVLSYAASNQVMTTTMTSNGTAFGPIKPVTLATNFTDFRVDAVALSSYSDTNADGSILAVGTVDNLVLVLPEPPIANLTGLLTSGTWQATFASRTNWVYTLERTADFSAWTPVTPPVLSAGYQMSLSDTNPPSTRAFYRVSATRP